MARLRSGPTTTNAPSTTQRTTSTRQALKEKTNITKTTAAVQAEDDEINVLVKPARPKRGRAKKTALDDESNLLMAGGLGGDESVRQSLLPTQHPATTDELAKSNEPAQPSAKPNRRPPRMMRKAVQHEAKSEISQEMKKRILANDSKTTAKNLAAQPNKASAGKAATSPAISQTTRTSPNDSRDRSAYSLSASPPPPSGLGAVKDKRPSLAQQGSTTKAQLTPAVESSILALKNFKRRPRQPSMLQMVQQRTASARPSAVNGLAIDDPTVFDMDDDDEEFAPDAAGTPLQVSKAESSAVALPDTRVTKRNADEADLSSSAALDTLRAKRRKAKAPQREEDSDASLSTSVADPAQPPNVSDAALLKSRPTRASSSVHRVTPQPYATSDVQVINSQRSATPPVEPSPNTRRGDEHLETAQHSAISQRHARNGQARPYDVEDDSEQDVPNGTMAEPASSSPLPSPHTTTRPTNVTADPSTQVSQPLKRGKAQKTKAKPMTTATLQSLLPKRRQLLKPRDRISEYDIESDEDQDEGLEREDPVEQSIKSRRQTKTAQSKGKKSLPATKSRSRQSRATNIARKTAVSQTRKSSAPPTAKNSSRTYGRSKSTASDKENEDDAAFESLDENDESILPDTSLSMYEAAQSKELEEARKKFAEVDDWDMEFESMSVDEGRSSSQEWR